MARRVGRRRPRRRDRRARDADPARAPARRPTRAARRGRRRRCVERRAASAGCGPRHPRHRVLRRGRAVVRRRGARRRGSTRSPAWRSSFGRPRAATSSGPDRLTSRSASSAAGCCAATPRASPRSATWPNGRADGGLRILGRGDAAITTAGATVLAEHVESRLRVARRASRARPSSASRTSSSGSASSRSSSSPTASSWSASSTAARAELSPVELPRRWFAMAVPRTDSGKVARGVLRDALASGGLARRVSGGVRAEHLDDRRGRVLVAARRSAIGTAGRAFAEHTVDALAAPVLAEVARAVAPAGLAVDDVVLGNCMGPGGDVARVAALRAGLGDDVPGVTVDRQCGSGLDAVLQSASRVRAGDARLLLAGGAESASTAPHRSWPGSGERYTRAPFAPGRLPRSRHGARGRPARRRARHLPGTAGRVGGPVARACGGGAAGRRVRRRDRPDRRGRRATTGPVPRWTSTGSHASPRSSRATTTCSSRPGRPARHPIAAP